MTLLHLSLPALLLGCAFAAVGQNAPPDPAPASVAPGQTENGPPPPDKRIFGVLPNYRTANQTAVYMPITSRQKFTIAAKDSFDYPLLGLSAALAGIGQWDNSNPSFGQGWAAYGHRVGVEYADQAIGNMM